MRTSFPFISQQQAIALLRIGVALVFFLHAFVRILNGTIPEFASFFNDKGFVYGKALVWAITAFEIAGSVLLAINYRSKCISAIFIFILVAGIILIHAKLGWFVGEHGTGGVEYSFALILALLVIAAGDTERTRLL